MNVASPFTPPAHHPPSPPPPQPQPQPSSSSSSLLLTRPDDAPDPGGIPTTTSQGQQPSYPAPIDTDAEPAHAYEESPVGASPDSAMKKEKRHRNKPSLSCTTCTNKKTKCDRTRPICFACQKRKSDCHYTPVANLIEETHRQRGLEGPRKKQRLGSVGHSPGGSMQVSPRLGPPLSGMVPYDRVDNTPAKPAPPMVPITDDYRPVDRTPSRSSTGSAPSLLSNIPFSHPTVSNLFKVEVGRVFALYFTRCATNPKSADFYLSFSCSVSPLMFLLPSR